MKDKLRFFFFFSNTHHFYTEYKVYPTHVLVQAALVGGAKAAAGRRALEAGALLFRLSHNDIVM